MVKGKEPPKKLGRPPKKKEEKNAEVKNKGGRPKIQANWDRIQKEVDMNQVLSLIEIQATAEEIAGFFRVSADTLDRRLKEELGCGFAELKKRLGDGAKGKASLRRAQFKMAETNSTMAIWLGKQYLGQTDHEKQTADAISSAATGIIDAADKMSGIFHEIESGA